MLDSLFLGLDTIHVQESLKNIVRITSICDSQESRIVTSMPLAQLRAPFPI